MSRCRHRRRDRAHIPSAAPKRRSPSAAAEISGTCGFSGVVLSGILPLESAERQRRRHYYSIG